MSGDTARTADYFSFLNLEPRFDLSMAELEERFRTLQQQHHPDRQGRQAGQVGQAQTEDAQAMLSAHLNEAYRALRSPVGRAHCLLLGLGVDPEENRNVLSPELLQEQFELRERLQQAGDSADLGALRELGKRHLDEASVAFAAVWAKAKVQETGPERRIELAACYHRLLFCDRFLHAVNEREDRLLD